MLNASADSRARRTAPTSRMRTGRHAAFSSAPATQAPRLALVTIRARPWAAALRRHLGGERAIRARSTGPGRSPTDAGHSLHGPGARIDRVDRTRPAGHDVAQDGPAPAAASARDHHGDQQAPAQRARAPAGVTIASARVASGMI